MGYDAFISHSSKDKDIANVICHSLEQNHINCWIAPRNVNGGFNYGAQIVAAIKSCQVMILVFSQNANASDDVKSEVQNAFKQKRVILPIRIDDTIADDEFDYFLSAKHWVDLKSIDTDLDNLVAAVRFAIQRNSHQTNNTPITIPTYAKAIKNINPKEGKIVYTGDTAALECGVNIIVGSIEIMNFSNDIFILVTHLAITNQSKEKQLSVTGLLHMLTDKGMQILPDESFDDEKFFKFPFIINKGYVYSGGLAFRIPKGTKEVVLYAENTFNNVRVGPIMYFLKSDR